MGSARLRKRYVVAGKGLSSREFQVAYLFSQGLSRKVIGDRLKMKPGTVQDNIKRAYKKLDIHNRDQLIKWMEKEGA